MIKFFRHIRRNLMETGKTGKYLKYAIGEIILVMIGILLALQVNNWNINKINSVKEIEYLTGLKNDLEKQITEIVAVKNFSDNILNQAETVLAEYNSKASIQDIDSLNTKLSQLIYTRHFPDIRTTFNELNSTGQINLILNKKLRSQIITFYQNASKYSISISGNIKDVFYTNVFPVLSTSIVIRANNFGYQVTKFDENEFEQKMHNQLQHDNYKSPTTFEIINAVSTRIIIENSTRNYIENSLKEAQALLIDIETELKK